VAEIVALPEVAIFPQLSQLQNMILKIRPIVVKYVDESSTQSSTLTHSSMSIAIKFNLYREAFPMI
jgi:hypothetical protein